jgi:hypothetical protein
MRDTWIDTYINKKVDEAFADQSKQIRIISSASSHAEASATVALSNSATALSTANGIASTANTALSTANASAIVAGSGLGLAVIAEDTAEAAYLLAASNIGGIDGEGIQSGVCDTLGDPVTSEIWWVDAGRTTKQLEVTTSYSGVIPTVIVRKQYASGVLSYTYTDTMTYTASGVLSTITRVRS